MDFSSLFFKKTSLTFSKLDKFQEQIKNYNNYIESEEVGNNENHKKIIVDNNLKLEGTKNLIETAYKRRTTKDYSCSDVISLDELNYIVRNSFGNYAGNSDNTLFNFPSAGAIYNCYIYLLVDKVEGLEKGIYLYNHLERAYYIINQEDSYAYLPYISINANALKESSFIIYVTVKLEKYLNKYGDRGLKFGLIEAGQLSQNLLLFSTELNLRTFTNGGYLDDKINLLLESGDNELLIANQIAVYK